MPDPYVSEVKYQGVASLDFVEIAVDAGTDVSSIFVTIYNADGSVQSVNALGTLVGTQFGQDIYVIDIATSGTFDGSHKSSGVALEQDGTLVSFISFDNGSPITATAGIANASTSTQIGLASGGKSLETTDGGATYITQATPAPGAIPCLCLGTMVETATGPIAVELLKPDMLIRTVDGQLLPLRLAIRRDVDAIELDANPKFRPIVIAANSLGHGVPLRDLWLSRQHRMLVHSPIVKRMTGSPEALIAAIHMVQVDGIAIDNDVTEVFNFHLLFDVHAVIIANGAATESLYLGAGALDAIRPAAVAEMKALFPHLFVNDVPPCSARFIPKGRVQKKLVERHCRNEKPFQVSVPRVVENVFGSLH